MKQSDSRKKESGDKTDECLDNFKTRLEAELRKPKFALEVAGFLVLLIYAVFTILMWSANRGSANAATKAANVAAVQARPVIWLTTDFGQPEYFTTGGQLTWEVHFKNYGQTPANEVITRDMSMRVGTDGQWEASYKGTDPFQILPPVGHPVAPTEEIRRTGVSGPGVSQQQFTALAKTDYAISIRGTVVYSDASGQPFESSFCLTRLAAGGITFCEGNYIH